MFSESCGFVSSQLLLKEMRRAARAADAAYELRAASDAAAGRLGARLRPEAAGGLRALRSKLLDESRAELERLREERQRERERREREKEAAAAARKK